MRNIFLCLFMIGALSACSSETPNRQDVEIEVGAGLNEVNVYSARKGYLLKPLIDEFEKSTKIKVNIISGKSKSLFNSINPVSVIILILLSSSGPTVCLAAFLRDLIIGFYFFLLQ